MLPTAIGPIWRKGDSASIQLRPPEMDKKRVSIPVDTRNPEKPPPGVTYIKAIGCEPPLLVSKDRMKKLEAP